MADQADYSEEDRRKAVADAQYYKQQGYTEAQIAAALGTPAPAQSYDAYAAAGPSTSSSAAAAAAAGGSHRKLPAGVTREVLDQDLIAQQSAYLPGAVQQLAKEGKYKPPPGKRDTVIRKAGGRVWEDSTLLDWDPKWYRLFVGDVSNDVSERTLDEAFQKYPSYCKSKVVRDRLSLKAKYGFIAFKDPEDFLRAWKENDGKYIGNRPIRLSKIKDDKYGGIATVQVSGRKAKQLDKLRANRGKPLDGRPVPY